jgi:hypothetical protein
MSRLHVEAEIKRLRIGAADMKHASAGAAHLAAVGAKSMNGDAKEALATGVVVSYSRPFTRHQGIGALDANEWTPADEAQAGLHRGLIWLRDKRCAHTDKTDYRGVEDVFRDGTWSASSVPLADEAWPRIVELAAAQAARMRELADSLEASAKSLQSSGSEQRQNRGPQLGRE